MKIYHLDEEVEFYRIRSFFSGYIFFLYRHNPIIIMNMCLKRIREIFLLMKKQSSKQNRIREINRPANQDVHSKSVVPGNLSTSYDGDLLSSVSASIQTTFISANNPQIVKQCR